MNSQFKQKQKESPVDSAMLFSSAVQAHGQRVMLVYADSDDELKSDFDREESMIDYNELTSDIISSASPPRSQMRSNPQQ